MSDLYDVIIIGGGPAGLSAAQYTARAKLKTVILDKSSTAGALAFAHKIENYPGLAKPVSGKELLEYLNMTLSGERIEKFLAVYLNCANEIIAVETLFEGTINQTAVYPRKVVEKALKHNAHAVIFVHNHPSGDSAPSETDKQLTVVLERAARAIDLNVVDHIIIGRGPHFSAREKGWMITPPRAAGKTGRSENMTGIPATDKDGA